MRYLVALTLVGCFAGQVYGSLQIRQVSQNVNAFAQAGSVSNSNINDIPSAFPPSLFLFDPIVAATDATEGGSTASSSSTLLMSFDQVDVFTLNYLFVDIDLESLASGASASSSASASLQMYFAVLDAPLSIADISFSGDSLSIVNRTTSDPVPFSSSVVLQPGIYDLFASWSIDSTDSPDAMFLNASVEGEVIFDPYFDVVPEPSAIVAWSLLTALGCCLTAGRRRWNCRL